MLMLMICGKFRLFDGNKNNDDNNSRIRVGGGGGDGNSNDRERWMSLWRLKKQISGSPLFVFGVSGSRIWVSMRTGAACVLAAATAGWPHVGRTSSDEPRRKERNGPPVCCAPFQPGRVLFPSLSVLVFENIRASGVFVIVERLHRPAWRALALRCKSARS